MCNINGALSALWSLEFRAYGIVAKKEGWLEVKAEGFSPRLQSTEDKDLRTFRQEASTRLLEELEYTIRCIYALQVIQA